MLGWREEMALRRKGCFYLMSVLLVVAPCAALTRNVTAAVGDSLTLKPDYSGEFSAIKWLFNMDRLVMLELPPSGYRRFFQLEDRATIDDCTGALTITRLTKSESGNYMAEVQLKNGTVRFTDIKLNVLDRASKPNIQDRSTEEKITVTCESATANVGYTWQDSQNNTVSTEQTYSVSRSRERVYLTCIVHNEVSSESSSIIIPPLSALTHNVTAAVGDSLTLKPDYSGEFSAITWLFNRDLLVVLELPPPGYLRFFQLEDRATIDNHTGALTITRLTKSESGNYTADVELKNRTVLSTDIKLNVLDRVSKPNIQDRSTEEKITVTCESATANVGYTWLDSQNNNVSTEQTYSVSRSRERVHLTCIVHNEVSSDSSSIIIPPLSALTRNVTAAVGDSLTLKPDYSGEFSAITWLFNRDLLVVLELQPPGYRRFFQLEDRATIDNRTGALTITHLAKSESGNYTAEVQLKNGTVRFTDIKLNVLDRVSKPNIQDQSTEKKIIVTCESATANVGYTWLDSVEGESE